MSLKRQYPGALFTTKIRCAFTIVFGYYTDFSITQLKFTDKHDKACILGIPDETREPKPTSVWR